MQCVLYTLSDMERAIDIRSLRKRLNWTQDRLAEYLGVDRSSISRMENGQPASGPVERLLSMLEKEAAQ
ncbi:helix-turn-helix domain-containing protein [Rhizobium johnstonii]|uniref:helix-turn-helix domain-containing protein n=2 Tax=Rhizobium johnstonii TaxID=3019933 RepID=UPI003F99A859